MADGSSQLIVLLIVSCEFIPAVGLMSNDYRKSETDEYFTVCLDTSSNIKDITMSQRV